MMLNKFNISAIVRVILGVVFFVSGFEKLSGPYQNFLYVIQSYDIVSPAAEEAAARVFPWLELILGVFLVLGLWTKWSLQGVIILILTFLFVVGQAILRQLPIDECGCFGQLISLPPHYVFLFDTTLLAASALTLLNIERARTLSLDRYFSDSS